MVYNTVIRPVKEPQMTEEKKTISWEYESCRGKANDNSAPGKRACHLTCNTCIQSEDWHYCNDCELGHCRLAIERIKDSNGDRGEYFRGQLTGEETLYHVLSFVNGQQQMINRIGERRYVEDLNQENTK